MYVPSSISTREKIITRGTYVLSLLILVLTDCFGIFFAWGFTPLQTLYSVECLENRTRAKGSGLNFLFLNVAM